MSVVTTPSITVINSDIAGNGPISMYSSPPTIRKSPPTSDSEDNGTMKAHVSPSSSGNYSPVSTVQLNSMSSPIITNSRMNSINGNSGRSSNYIQGPMAIFTPCSNSHPFEERRIQVARDEEHAIKIGRAVARFQPSHNNAIFDCKVGITF
jgi:hypothetical protein